MKTYRNSFVITSDDCSDSKNILVGYAIWRNEIYTSWSDNLLEVEDWKQVQGEYVAICRKQETFSLYRDPMGLVRLYYFECDGYWAISNSFWQLCEVLKSQYYLTLNMGYAEALMAINMTAYIPYESLCNEIKVLSVFDEVKISIASKQIEIENNYPFKEIYMLDSKESFEIIDKWISYWGTLIKSLECVGYNISIDLSGGYDSRISYAIAKAADVDFTKENVSVYCVKPDETGAKNHFSGDYEIAEQIAQIHGVALVTSLKNFGENKISAQERFAIYEDTLSDCMNEAFDREYYYNPLLIKWGGYLGETVRGYESIYQKNDLIHRCCINNGVFQDVLPMKRAVKEILGAYRYVQQITQSNVEDSRKNALQFCFECLDGAFFGKQIQQYLRLNTLCISPFMDSALRNIQVNEGYKPELLYAVLLARTCPELLRIPYCGEAGFTEDEIQYVKNLNEKYENKIQIVRQEDIQKSVGIAVNPYKLSASNNGINSIIEERFKAKETRQMLERKFGKAGRVMYELALKRLERPVFQKDSYAAAICSIVKMINIEDASAKCVGSVKQEVMKEPTWEELYAIGSGCFAIDNLHQAERESARIQEYIDCARRNSAKEIYLYGAGEYAKEVVEIFASNGIEITGFIVTKQSEKVFVMGKPVVGKDDFCFQKDKMLIFPAVSLIYVDAVKKAIAEIENRSK